MHKSLLIVDLLCTLFFTADPAEPSANWVFHSFKMSSSHSIHVVQLCSASFATMQDTDPYAWLQYFSVTWTSGLGLSMATGKARS
jgi:hypothetical protein